MAGRNLLQRDKKEKKENLYDILGRNIWKNSGQWKVSTKYFKKNSQSDVKKYMCNYRQKHLVET